MPDNKKTKIIVKTVKPKAVSKVGDIELTDKFATGQKAMEKNIASKKVDVYNDADQGISVESKSLEAKPKVFKRRVVAYGGPTGTTRIMGDDDKTILFEGRSRDKGTKEALRKSENKSTDVNQRRETNANLFNVDSAAKSDLTDKDKISLIARRKATAK